MPPTSAPSEQFSAALDYAKEFLEKCYEKFGPSTTASFSAYCTEMAIINLPGLANNYCDILARRDLMFYRYAPAVLAKIIRELREDIYVTKGEASRKNNEPKLLEHLKVGKITGKHASRWALLHKSCDGRASPFPGQTYPATSVMGVPSAVKPLSTATRTWNSPT